MRNFLICMVLFITVGNLQAKRMAMAFSPDDPTLYWGPCPDIFPKGCEVAVLHGDPAKPKADIFLRVPAKYVFPSHTHTSPEHMVLVSGEMTVQYERQQPLQAKAGTYLYGPGKEPHKAQCADQGQCVLFVAFELPIDAFKAKDF